MPILSLWYYYSRISWILTLSWRGLLSYRNQSINLRCKSMDWFLYDNGLRYERVKQFGEYKYLRNFPFRVYLKKSRFEKFENFRINFAKLIEINHLDSYLLDFVIGSSSSNKKTGRFRCEIWEINLWRFVFLLKKFPNTAALIQITLLYSCFLQKFGL